jgi:hypothetical protein
LRASRSTSAHFVSCTGQPIQIEKDFPEMRDQQGGQRLVLMRFDRDCAITRGDGQPLDFIEQHGLADATQPRQ